MKTQEQINNERTALKKYLGANCLTVTELANKLGITQSALSSQISRGISTGLYARCAVALNCEIEDLQPRNETAAPTAKKRLSFPFQCSECGKIHTITIEID